MRVFALVPLLGVVSLVFSHPGGGTHDQPATREELIARNIKAKELRNCARRCGPQIAEFESMRYEKRNKLIKRPATSTFSAVTPRITAIQKGSYVLQPVASEGPYYIRNEFIRNDQRETQAGVTLILDIGVIDSRTCKPYPKAFVEIWSANATGAYGGYVGANGDPSRIHVDTFLRGGHFTNDAGLVELTTIYPGYYTGRTPHIHAVVHGGDWQSRANGTFVSGSGSVNYIGQLYFEDCFNDKVFALSPYNTVNTTRIRNAQDRPFNAVGTSSIIGLEYLHGTDVQAGLLGYLTLVVDGASSYNIKNSNALR